MKEKDSRRVLPLIIDGIEDYPNNRVVIMDRWGNVIWETLNYDNQSNNWTWKVEESVIVSSMPIPDGLYHVYIYRDDDSLLRHVLVHYNSGQR